MQHRQRSRSACDAAVFPSNGECETFHSFSAYSPRNRKSSGRTRKASGSRATMNRRDRYSSGYGSLDESTDATESSRNTSAYPCSTESASPSSPPPRYQDLNQVPEYVQMPDEGVDTTSDFGSFECSNSPEEWAIGSARPCSTVVEVPDETDVRLMKTSGRDRSVYAPDMILCDKHGSSKSPTLQVRVDGEIVQYQKLQLANNAEAMQCLREHSKKHILWCTDALRKCTIAGSDVAVLFRYQLFTLYEHREIEVKTKPYRGERLKEYRRPQSKYDYDVELPSRFRETSACFPLENTERLKGCQNCNQTGKDKCNECKGLGTATCERCHGEGHEVMTIRTCYECNGGCQTICRKCLGSGRGDCTMCQGRGKVVAYKVLKVDWTVKRSSMLEEMDEIPKKYLESAKGEVVLQESRRRLAPIGKGQLLHERIREFSEQVQSNHRAYKNIVQQRHFVDIIPIQALDCCYKDKAPFRFYIVGKDRTVYAPNFPKKRFSALSSLFS